MWLVLAALSVGCGNGFLLADSKLSCEHNPHDWYDTPTYSLLESNSRGAFDFDPGGDPVTDRSGSYDLSDGDFSWTDAYDGNHYLVSEEVSGYGTVYANGNLDVLYQATSTDILNDSNTWRVRAKRNGCEATWEYAESDPGRDLELLPEEDAFTYTWWVEIESDDAVRSTWEDSEGGYDYWQQNVQTSDLVTYQELDYVSSDSGYNASSTYYGTGTGESDWEQYDDDYSYVGRDDYYFDGSQDVAYDVYEDGDKIASISYTAQYDGSAEGTYAYESGGDWYECDMVMGSDGSCTLDCDGTEYDC
ncbi:MAG: hypothetical protein QGG40_03205 [Myxococcota bacterium]|jgi:hypothetical protein|nr:hypothetical protein [Myxococcota bacterium]